MGWHLSQAAEPVALSHPVEKEREGPLVPVVAGDLLASLQSERGLTVGLWDDNG